MIVYDRANSVIDISSVMTLMQVFRDGAFDELTVSAQAEILKDRIRRLSVRANGVYVEVFGEKPEPLLSLVGKNGEISKNENLTPLSTRSNGTGVRPVFKLVPLFTQPAKKYNIMISLRYCCFIKREFSPK